MRVAYYALHYGKEYLAHSIKSIQDAVDEIYFFYASTPSYGFQSPLPCPDSKEALRAELDRFTIKPFYWIDGAWPSEGAHRKAALDHARNRGAKLVLVVDADEIWAPGSARQALDYVWHQNRAGRWMARFTNFWRSFDWVVNDHFTPIRVVDLRHSLTVDAQLPDNIQPVLHFGYAQREELMNYKWTCHGHQRELRPGWFEKFRGWTPESVDLHPCVNDLWARAESTSDETKIVLENTLRDHPYYGVELIR